MRLFLLAPLCAALLLGGCDQLGIESASAVAARKEADGKAIGAGCRHAARSVEDCYANNKRAERAAIFAGWKEMNDYMRAVSYTHLDVYKRQLVFRLDLLHLRLDQLHPPRR